MTNLTDPHEFVGRHDRWCEVCNRPDRDAIHKGPFINGRSAGELRARCEANATAECTRSSCLEPEVHELSTFLIGALDEIERRRQYAIDLETDKRLYLSALDSLESILFGDMQRRSRDEMEARAEHLNNVAKAAHAFIDTTAIRHSQIAGRDVPSGFTAASSDASVALYDVLREGPWA